jgi:hypothetical protein
MKLYKTNSINVRVNPVLKKKFEVAIWFLWLSDVISAFMQDYVRDYENKMWKIIPVWIDDDSLYNIITQLHGVKLSRSKFDELQSYYPKTRKDIYIKNI